MKKIKYRTKSGKVMHFNSKEARDNWIQGHQRGLQQIHGPKDKKQLLVLPRRMRRKKEEVYTRFVPSIKETDLKRPSIESFKHVDDAGIFNSSDEQFLLSYYRTHWYPSLPEGVTDLDEFEWYLDDEIAKARKGDKAAQRALLEALPDDMTKAYSHVKDIKGIGPSLVAKGVYANAEGMQFVHTYPYEVEFTGEFVGGNLFEDGVVVKPKRILSITDKRGRKIDLSKIKTKKKRRHKK